MDSLVPVPTSTAPASKLYRCIKTANCNCSVCGKAATGTHYLTVACNGCRSFFRRSIVYKKKYECKKSGSNRQECYLLYRCKFCRLALCFSSGMNPEALQTDCDDEEADEDVIEEALIVQQPYQIESKMELMMLKLLGIEEAHDRLRLSSYCPRHVEGLTLDEYFFGPSKLGMGYTPMRSTPYEPVSIDLVPSEKYIREKVIIDFRKFDYATKKLWMFQDEVYSIEFIKALPIYHLLDDCSKRVLLASALACSNFTAAFFSYMRHSDRTCYPDGITMTWKREIQEQSPDSTRFHTEIIATIREAHLDKREYTLLKMILVCNPLLDGLTPYDLTLLQHEKECCTKTLLSYVLARRGVKDGPAIFGQILSIVDVVIRLTAWQKSMHILMLGIDIHAYRVPFVETIMHSQ